MGRSVEISPSVLCESRVDEPTTARFQLGSEITVHGPDLTVEIELSDVFDVRIGPPPQAAAENFAGSVLTIGFDGRDGREVLFVNADGDVLENVAGLLYRRLLDGSEVAVRYPAKVGSRVTERSFDIGELLVAPGKVGCQDIETPFLIDLDTVVNFSRSTKELLGETRTIIDVRYVDDRVPVSLELWVTPARRQHLLGRFLRSEYESIREDVRDVDLSESEFRALVELYSRRGAAEPDSLRQSESDSTTANVRSLVNTRLVEIDDGEAVLTPRGWILVTDHVGTGDERRN